MILKHPLFLHWNEKHPSSTQTRTNLQLSPPTNPLLAALAAVVVHDVHSPLVLS